MARLANQIVCICAWLTSFQPALIPQPSNVNDADDIEVMDYFDSICESEYDADSEESDYECL